MSKWVKCKILRQVIVNAAEGRLFEMAQSDHHIAAYICVGLHKVIIILQLQILRGLFYDS